MDKIKITNLKVFAHHGVYSEENKNGQNFFVNATLYTDTRKAGKADSLEQSTDYGEVCHFINKYMTEHTFKLIETVAEGIAEQILLKFPFLSSVEIEICKPQAPIGLPFTNVSVSIARGWKRAFLGIGSNLGDKQAYMEQAVQSLKAEPKIKNIKISSIIETEPYGRKDQDVFLNGAIGMETLFSPFELLEFLHILENNAGRTREVYWGPRTLDLDILLYENESIHTDELTIPHKDMQNRAFVLKPLAEIIPYFIHPLYQKSIEQMRNELEDGH